ncbi:TonB-dependent receptor [uncultured Bacteroides sp.]|jgi:TonB-linked SusC/RagA family outer membrane protein|uniref:SusC/RagA family TonB-linked outer membrane protein n=1 Tax=uncultured Bacteroides sp. TaxID=162156 RepID=UPI0025D314F7|nr:TonB-dependent receptor [uncultured Bacteroides sp.]
MLMQVKSICLLLTLLGSGAVGSVCAASHTDAAGIYATQQEGTCTGVVNDAMGPVIGASVLVKGTSNGAITDMDGKFSLSNVKKGDILQISFVGYATQEVQWTGQPLSVFLKDDTKKLDEVVVVGYGTQKKVNLTGAVTMAEGDVLQDRPIANVTQGLQGAIPNLNITFDGGSPTASASINVRGATSLNGGSALILVDGVETSDISLVNPQDIESISVLKDASSAAVYGARAAFGVVLITTKKGAKGQKLRVNYNNNFSWSTPSRLPEGINSSKWIHAINQCADNSDSGKFSSALVEAIDRYNSDPVHNPYAFLDETGSITAKGQWAYAANTDWFDEFYKKAAFMQQHNASISGGSDKSSYYGSVGYKGQDGLFAFGNDSYKRINMTFNFSTQLTDWLEVSFRTKYNRNEDDLPYTQEYMGSNPFHEVYRAFPFVPIYLPDGNFAAVEGSGFNYNIAGIMAQAGRDITKSDDFWYTGAFTLTPLKGLSIKGDYTGNKFFKQQKQHNKQLYQIQPDGSYLTKSSSKLNNNKYNDTYQALNLWAEYKLNIKDHGFGIMAGYNQESKNITALTTTVSDLYDNNTPISSLATTTSPLGEEATIWAVQGVFFRLNYDYKSRYLVEVNGRYDGSSKYKSGSRWGFFPSVSLGWRLSEEKFFEPAKKVFDNVKVRASLGTLGNQVTNGNFDYLGYLASEGLSYVMGGKELTGLKAPTLASTNITWEKVTTANFGLDLGLLNNRLNASFDYYIRYTNDMVIAKAYPAVLGTTGGKENLANMRTNGWELSLSWNDQIDNVAGSPLNYSIGFGLADSYSTITKYDNPYKALSDYYEGMRIGEIWGYVTDGFIQTEEEAKLMNTLQGEISKSGWKVGDIRYKDLDGKEGITKARTATDTGDQKVIGNTTPRFSYNITGGLSWKNFDVRVFFEGIGKRDIWVDSPVFWGFSGNEWQSAVNDYHVDNSWSPENQNAYFPIPTFSSRSKQVQTKYLQNGAYIRLKDLTISYTLPKKWLSPVGIDQLKVFASGQNLWVGTKLFKYLDPDIVSTRRSKTDGDNLAGTLTSDGKAYPFSKTYSVGINLTF